MTTQEFVPYLSVTDAKEAVAFCSRDFDTAPTLLLNMPDARVMHCEFRIGSARFFLSEELPEHGAQVLVDPVDMFWGERFARVRDPFGHEWGITKRLRDMTPAEIQAAAAKMFEEMSE